MVEEDGVEVEAKVPLFVPLGLSKLMFPIDATGPGHVVPVEEYARLGDKVDHAKESDQVRIS
jgi:hypothetical protein